MASIKNTVTAILGVDSSGVKKGLNEADGAVGGSSKKLAAFGKMAAAAFAAAAAAAVAFAAKALKSFVEFDKGMKEVFTLLPGINAKAMGQMEKDVLNLSRTMGTLPEETVPALYQALSAGVPKENVFNFLEKAGQAAIGGVTDIKTSVDGLTSVVNAYGSETMSVEEAADAMFTTVKLGKTTFEEISRSIAVATPIAKAAGVSFDDLSAMIAALTARGTPTSEAMTQIRSAILALNTPTEKGLKVADKYGLSFKKMAEEVKKPGGVLRVFRELREKTNGNVGEMKALLGRVEAVNAVMGLTEENGKLLANAIEEMGKKGGAAEAAFKTMEKSFGYQIQKMQARWEAFKITFGQALAPILRALGPIFDEVLKAMESLPFDKLEKEMEGLGKILGEAFGGKNQSFIKTLVELAFDFFLLLIDIAKAVVPIAAALKPVVVVLAKLLSIIAKIVGFILQGAGVIASLFTGQTSAVEALFRSLGAGEEEAARLAKKFVDTFAIFHKIFKWVAEWIGAIVQSIKEAYNRVMYWVRGAREFIKAEGGGVGGFIKGLFKVIGGMIAAFIGWAINKVKKFLADVWDIVHDIIPTLWSFVKDKVTELGQAIYELLPGWIQKAIDSIWDVIKEFFGTIKDGYLKLWYWFKDKIAAIWKMLDEYFPGLTKAIKFVYKTVVGVVDAIVGKVSWLIGKVKGAYDKAKGWFKSLIGSSEKAQKAIDDSEAAARRARAAEIKREAEKRIEDERQRRYAKAREESAKRATARKTDISHGSQLLAKAGMTPEVIGEMVRRLGFLKKEHLLEDVGSGEKSIEELLIKAFGPVMGKRMLAMGAANAAHQKLIGGLVSKSLSKLASEVGLTEKEMIDAFHAGRLKGPYHEAIKIKLEKRAEIQKRMLGTTEEEIAAAKKAEEEKERQQKELMKRVRAEEERQASEYGELKREIFKEGEAITSDPNGLGEIIEGQIERANAGMPQEIGEAVASETAKVGRVEGAPEEPALEKVATSVEGLEFPDCMSLCDETIEKLGEEFRKTKNAGAEKSALGSQHGIPFMYPGQTGWKIERTPGGYFKIPLFKGGAARGTPTFVAGEPPGGEPGAAMLPGAPDPGSRVAGQLDSVLGHLARIDNNIARIEHRLRGCIVNQ